MSLKCSEITGGHNETRYYLAEEKETRPQSPTRIAELVRPLLTTSLTHGYVRRKRVGRVREMPGLAQKSKTNKWPWRHRADESRHPPVAPVPPLISHDQVFLRRSLPPETLQSSFLHHLLPNLQFHPPRLPSGSSVNTHPEEGLHRRRRYMPGDLRLSENSTFRLANFG